MAQAALDAICVKIARGTEPQMAVDEFAPPSSTRNGIQHWLQEYLEEQGVLCERRELSPTHVRELRRCARPDGYFSRRAWCWPRSRTSSAEAFSPRATASGQGSFELSISKTSRTARRCPARRVDEGSECERHRRGHEDRRCPWVPIDEELAEWVRWRLEQEVQARRCETAMIAAMAQWPILDSQESSVARGLHVVGAGELKSTRSREDAELIDAVLEQHHPSSGCRTSSTPG